MNTPERSFSAAFAGRFAVALPTTELSDTVATMSAAMNELLKDRGATEDVIDVLSLDGNQSTPVLRFSALVIVFRTRKNETRLAYHTLILAGSAPKLEPQYVNLNQNPMYGGVQGKTEVVLVPGDAYDEDYRTGVEGFVKRQFPSIAERVAADARVVAADFDFNDKRAVKLLANSAITAAGVRFLELDGITEIDISQIPTRPDQFSIRTSLISPNDDDMRDLSGNPVRADFKTVFGSSQVQRQGLQQSLNGGTASNFTQATGYVDLVQTYQQTFNYFQQPQQNQFGQFGPIRQPYARFAPRVIITSLRTLMGPATLTSTMLALFGTFALAEPNALYPFFESQGPSGSGINVREIGALNVKANLEGNETGLGARVNTSGTDFNRMQLSQYLGTVLEPEVYFSIDIEECGDDTWVNYPLAMAASLDDNLSRKGNQLIAGALDLLTGGNFTRIHAPTGKPIVMQGAERIINGKYPDRTGKIRDLRTIDYLHVSNLEQDNAPQTADAYANTFIATTEPLPQRISNRLQIFRSLYPSISLDSVTGYSQRITLTPEGINSFIEAMSAAKLNVANIPAGSGLGLQAAPIYQSLQGSGVHVAAHSVFNKVVGGFGGNVGRGNGGRW
jgi:hypothetical protein